MNGLKKLNCKEILLLFRALFSKFLVKESDIYNVSELYVKQISIILNASGIKCLEQEVEDVITSLKLADTDDSAISLWNSIFLLDDGSERIPESEKGLLLCATIGIMYDFESMLVSTHDLDSFLISYCKQEGVRFSLFRAREIFEILIGYETGVFPNIPKT